MPTFRLLLGLADSQSQMPLLLHQTRCSGDKSPSRTTRIPKLCICSHFSAENIADLSIKDTLKLASFRMCLNASCRDALLFHSLFQRNATTKQPCSILYLASIAQCQYFWLRISKSAGRCTRPLTFLCTRQHRRHIPFVAPSFQIKSRGSACLFLLRCREACAPTASPTSNLA